jgi:hypothetical protein
MLNTLLKPSTWATQFPMVRAGGLFILIMGIAVLLGALLPRGRGLLLILGGIAATVSIVLLAGRLSAPFGKPTAVQFYFLFGSIVLEIILIRLVKARYRAAGERILLLAILLVVGLHFLPMAVAFGPMCFALGFVLCLSSGIGVWLAHDLPVDLCWAVDGILKIACGALMFFVY